MICDTQVRREIEQEWSAVQNLCADTFRVTLTPYGELLNETPPESFYNLPLVLAFGLFERVLAQLGDEGAIPKPRGRRPPLGARMKKSTENEALCWNDYALVERGQDARNKLAHEAELLPKADCIKFIDAVEVELQVWRVL